MTIDFRWNYRLQTGVSILRIILQAIINIINFISFYLDMSLTAKIFLISFLFFTADDITDRIAL